MRRRRWFLHRTVVMLALVGSAWTCYALAVRAAAPGKVAPAVVAQTARGSATAIVVTLPFRPEEFHIRFLQDRGTVTGVDGTSIHLARVRPAVVWSIARLYWVTRISGEPGAGTKG